MIKKIAPFLLFCIAAFQVQAQDSQTPEKSGRPDIPGTFVLEIGVNRALDAPAKFSTGLWGSRTVNLYYQYEMRIANSKFSFVPGVGL
ncbi:MAG TPA: hypothetical protein VEB86_06785, partial [Chryseosolibacter sp.]|nr:hypothetical protein [Chryseosolibacter sp.]